MKAIDLFSKLSRPVVLLLAAWCLAWAAPRRAVATDEAAPGDTTPAVNATSEAESTGSTDTPPEVSWVDTLPERDPFWPVGYVKPELRPKEDPAEAQRQAQVQAVKQKVTWPELTILSVARGGGRYIAMIGDGVGIVQAGDIAEIQRGGMVYRWDIVQVSARGVAYRRKDVAPIGREDERIPYVEARGE